jgi:hypothetical protein
VRLHSPSARRPAFGGPVSDQLTRRLPTEPPGPLPSGDAPTRSLVRFTLWGSRYTAVMWWLLAVGLAAEIRHFRTSRPRKLFLLINTLCRPPRQIRMGAAHMVQALRRVLTDRTVWPYALITVLVFVAISLTAALLWGRYAHFIIFFYGFCAMGGWIYIPRTRPISKAIAAGIFLAGLPVVLLILYGA